MSKERIENIKYFSTSLIFLILSKAISLLLRMGSRIIIARFSSVEIYGLFSVIWSEMTFISTLALLGLGQKLTIDLPREKKIEKRKSIISSLVYASIVGTFSLIVSIILNIINLENSYKYSTLIAAMFVIFLFVQFIFIGMKDFFGYFIQSISQSLSMFIMIVILRNVLAINLMIYVAFGSIVFSILLSGIYLLIKNKKEIHTISLKEIKIFDFSKERWNLFFVDIINCIILYLLLKLPQVIISNSLAGFVNVAFSLITFLIIPPQMIAVVLGPKLSEDFFNKKLTNLQNSFRISLSLLYISQGFSIITFSYFGNFFIELLYGSKFLPSSSLIFYGFLLAVIIDSFNYPFALYIRNTNNEGLFALGKAISFVTFVIPEVLLLSIFGDYSDLAVPIAYLISILSLLAFYLFYTIKLNAKMEKKDIRKLLLWLAVVFTSTILAMITRYFLKKQLFVLFVTAGNLFLFSIYLIISKTINIKGLIIESKELINSLK
ncbi:MAG: oligosaccharide flippase family protein [Candidatus Heimdallarchaeota archaeon]|nr:oligosaccharide flippase family protein [Candidatus Heimdallarchaeota archaeon]